MVNEVDDESLDVRAIVILISHYHDRTVAQIAYVCVHFTDVQSHYLYQILQLLILQNLGRACVTYIHKFAF